MIQFIKLSDVINITGLSRPTVYRLAKQSLFPKPIKLTPYGRSSAWVLEEVHEWMNSRIEASRLQSEASQ